MHWHSHLTTAEERYERLIADVAAARALRRMRPDRPTLGGRLSDRVGDALIQLGQRIRSGRESIEIIEEDGTRAA